MKIVLLEDYPCEDKEQLLKRERHYIESLICVNKRIPSRPQKEYKKLYREKNKESIKAKK